MSAPSPPQVARSLSPVASSACYDASVRYLGPKWASNTTCIFSAVAVAAACAISLVRFSSIYGSFGDRSAFEQRQQEKVHVQEETPFCAQDVNRGEPATAPSTMSVPPKKPPKASAATAMV